MAKAGSIWEADTKATPGCAQDFAGVEGLEGHDGSVAAGDLQRDATFTNQIEGVGVTALTEDMLAGFKADVFGAAGDQLPERPVEPGEERVFGDDAPQAIHQFTPSPPIAAASSVMSMPTGHQVMHRPQPTQPDTSNWSIQPASLWVIHWR